ncbi:MAG: AAA family ATPase [Candidatus Melainabacteria bacterium]|nr:AAA family ATPase [Candidatus Melainabacteria bacterium]
MIRRFIGRIIAWYRSEYSAQTIVQLSALLLAAAVFVGLTTGGAFNKEPVFLPAKEYQHLTLMKSEELEQKLRQGSNEVTELVFFMESKSVAVLGPGFEQERLVYQADVDEIRRLATEKKIPFTERPGTRLTDFGSTIKGWWWVGLMTLIVATGFFLFKRRSEEMPNRITTFFMVGKARVDGFIEARKLKKSRFYLWGLGVLAVVISGLLTVHAIVSPPVRQLPAEYSRVQKSTPWQVERYLKQSPESFERAVVIDELNAVYVVLKGQPKADAPDDKPTAFGRIALPDPNSASEVAEAQSLISTLSSTSVPTKHVEVELNDNIFSKMTGFWSWLFIVLGVFTSVWLIGVMLNWDRWRQEEGVAPPKRNGAVPAAGPASYAVGGAVEVREEDKKTFKDVAGCQEAIDELRVVEKKIRRPRLYKAFGAPVPSGVLLYGPPGTGKTLLARALSGEIGGHFEALSGSQFVEMYVGVGAKRVREAYTRARAAARKSGRISIIFIDEIDAIAKKRGGGAESGGDKEYEQTLNELLVQMNGFGNHGLVLTMAATNRLDILDEAILRPGRFDVKVQVPKPDKKGRAQIYNVYLRKLKIVHNAEGEEARAAAYEKLLDDLARRSHDFSGAEIEGAIKNGATIAVERQFGEVTDDISDEQFEQYQSMAIITVNDLNEGVDKMAYGTQIKSRVRTDKERWATAIHECGHATVPTVLGGDPVNRITIVMTDKSLGLMDSSPEEGERYDWTDAQFLIRLQMMLAGRAAEKVILGKISTGASNDFERASALARQMVGFYGMSKEFGVKSLPLDRHGFPVSNIGEIMLDKFNATWGKLIDDMEAATDAIIEKHRTQIEACARVLFEEETLTGDDFRRIWREATPAAADQGDAAAPADDTQA